MRSKFKKTMLRPLYRFLDTQNLSSRLLFVATIAALILANSSYAGLYERFWHTILAINVGSFSLSFSLAHWISDGLMAIFFFVIGLEIKREILVGELSDWQKAGLPIFAAIGGMLVPALIYLLFNYGEAGSRGWGIPMATDIAFALGCLLILGDKISPTLKVFLLALAIVDDIGAILVIALFYTSSISLPALIIALGILLLLLCLNILNINEPAPYVILGILLWLAVLQSGLHTTLAGVILAMFITAKSLYTPKDFVLTTKQILKEFPEQEWQIMCVDSEQRQALRSIEEAVNKTDTPLQRLEDAIHPLSAYLIIPLFALANAGVDIFGSSAGVSMNNPITLGVLAGLILGKQIGITLFAYLAVRMSIASLPDGMCWWDIYGLSCLGGIGFSMSLFISNLAFASPLLLNQAKIGIIMASIMSAIIGVLVLKRFSATEST